MPIPIGSCWKRKRSKTKRHFVVTAVSSSVVELDNGTSKVNLEWFLEHYTMVNQ
jgi:hypothetical protein